MDNKKYIQDLLDLADDVKKADILSFTWMMVIEHPMELD